MTIGKTLRLNRIFNQKDKRALVVAADHGWMTDVTDNVIQLKKIIQQVSDGGADAILISFGTAERLGQLLQGHDKPAVIIRADWMNMPRLGSGGASDSNVVPVQRFKRVDITRALDALKIGASAITIYYFIGYSDDFEAENIKNCAAFARECEKIGLPLIIEPIATGGRVTGANIAELLIASARIAAEIGADVLKIPYTGDIYTFSKLVDEAKIPVLMLGGARSKNPRDALELVEEALASGASGVVFGRNVTRAKDPKKMVRDIYSILHEGKKVDDIFKIEEKKIKLKIDNSKCSGCLSCMLQCSYFHENLYGGMDVARLKIINEDFNSKIHICNFCGKCIEACEKEALKFNEKMGFVELIQEKCDGCKKCLQACPNNVIVFKDNKPLFCDLCNGNPQCVKWCFENAIVLK